MIDSPLARRRILTAALAGAALVALRRVHAGMPLLTGREPDAATLSFVPDASRLTPEREPAFKPGSHCARCYFFDGTSSSADAPCTVFSGWRVPATGWCREFTPR